MDLTLANLRELFQNLLGNTGGRRGREREQVRQQQDGTQGAVTEDPAGQGFPGEPSAEASQQPGAAAGQQQPAGQTGDPANAQAAQGGGADATDTSSTDQSTSSFDQDRPDSDELDDDEVVDDLYHRIETLEEELERNGTRLGSIRDAQESVSDDIEEVNDTVRRLLGVYDRLTEQVNPFTGAGEEAEGFGVFGENHEEGFGLNQQTTETGGASISFDDLRSAVEEADGAGEPQRIPFEDELDDEPGKPADADRESDETSTDASVEVQATDEVAGEEATDVTEDDDADADDSDVTLSSLADTYAADLLVFEWLTELVRTGGPSATLRAISYYHEIGWIDDDVRQHLEAVLSGPDLDIHVDPERTPEELTAEDHADSYEYIMKLQEVHEASAEVEL
ncbi:putative archaeal flagellar protein D/E [Halovivax ruber XH-70]|uniref:Putative archaeal flagellar protein D/E n=1 Tax=Halovivax ruber (strain DSM 18193 / JCM 13892 / XH-70) TaxID=797302 RepID=L0I8R3_HALRX|nr:FlaD/FlaE family flagellar protein [Halovivax ruber]AGB15198.1 putative archaeal flagellar protein D/E [Halovivax ruber XH-70]